MIRQLLIVMFIGLGGTVLAQTGSVTGKIMDADSGEPLIGATVLVKGTNKGSIADLNGSFEIKNIPSGTYNLLFSYIGYQNLSVEVTIADGQTTDVGTAKLPSDVVGLKEVEVFASVIDDRKTPIAISAINALEIQERFVGTDVADIIQNTPGVYTTQGAGGYGDQEVYIRGFDQSNVAFMVNGVPVNDMENGRMFWSNFAGLNEVTRQIQVQRGLGASKLAISSIGGTVNMITKPAEKSEGGRMEYQMGTGSWNERIRFSYHTGLKNGWAVSFQGSRTKTDGGLIGLSSDQQGSIVPGAYTDAWSYYLAISKKINQKHQVMFWGFGAPVDRGTAWVVDDTTRAVFNITEPMANNALGTYRGELFNARQNKIDKPLMALTHYWDFNEKSSLSTSVYASFAKVYSTQPVDSENSTFFGNIADSDEDQRRVPTNSFFTPDNLINWDVMAAANRQSNRYITVPFPNGDINTPEIQGYESRFYLESRHNNHKWVGLISNYKKQIDNLNLTGGIDMRYYRGEHYAQVFNTFGGDFVRNESSFGDDFNKLEPNGVARTGDKINYNYDGVVRWASGFIQGEYNLNKVDVFATISGTYNDYKRIGYFWNGRDRNNFNSLGESELVDFLTYSVKAGASYRPTNRHNFFANVGHFTRPPFFRDIYEDARYNHLLRDGLTSEKIYAVEGGYSYRTSVLKANVNAYYINWTDRTTTGTLPNEVQGDNPNPILPFVLNGLVSVHQGIELDVTYNATSTLEFNGFISLGDWKWDNSVRIDQIVEGDTLNSRIFNMEGLPVGTSAQTTAGIGFHYRGIKDMYVGGRLNYADRIAISYSPEDVSSGFVTSNVINNAFDDYYTLDIYLGRYFNMGEKTKARLAASVNNVTNTEYTRWASYFFNQTQRAQGYPRTYTISLSIEF